jgi:hypothetical protein
LGYALVALIRHVSDLNQTSVTVAGGGTLSLTIGGNSGQTKISRRAAEIQAQSAIDRALARQAIEASPYLPDRKHTETYSSSAS